MTRLCLVLFAAALVSAAAHPFDSPSRIRDRSRVIREILVGGDASQDPNGAEYKKLAQESFEKFSETYPGGPMNAKEIKVTKVTTQVVSGIKTKIDFTVVPANGDEITCHSDIWEQSWLKKKDINVNCDINQQKTKVKRQVPGGEVEKDPNSQEYKKLAQESLAKFSETNPGGPINAKEIKVTKVTTQVVSGIKTKIDFTVVPANGDEITCHSDIWEQSWLNKKDINVNCDINQQKTKVKRQVAGGVTEKDPNSQEYKKLAQESLAKFSETSPGGPITAKEIKVTKVTYQTVAGSLTKLTFTVEPVNGEKFTCNSEVWDRPWLNKKEITVKCD